MNIAILSGNVGKDPEMSYSQAGVAVCKFSLATAERVKGENVSTWHNIVCFQKTAELVSQYVKKGSRIGIEGKIQNRSYDQDGVKKYISEVIANKVEFQGSKQDGQGQQTGHMPPVASQQPYAPIDDDKIPF